MRAIKDAFHGIFKNFLMSAASVIIMTACMLIVGSALLLVANLNAFVVQMQKEDEVAVYIDETADAAAIAALKTDLEKNGNVAEIVFFSKEEALAEYESMFPDQKGLFTNLEENNPLRASYHIKIADLERYDETLAEIGALKNVVNVRGSSEVVNTLVVIRRSVTLIGAWIFAILMFVSIFIVSNTIRMTIFARREEISIMKYVGATDGYIRRPFVAEGLILGLLSCAAAFALEWTVYDRLIGPMVRQLAIFQPMLWSDIRWFVLGGFALFSVLMGVLGSLIPMRKHLHV